MAIELAPPTEWTVSFFDRLKSASPKPAQLTPSAGKETLGQVSAG